MREQLLSGEPSSQDISSLPRSGGSVHSSGRSSGLQLILASTSPRRSQLLTSIGIPFTVVPPVAEEPSPTPEDERSPGLYVERLAVMKATACPFDEAVTSKDPELSDIIVLAADTVVWHEGRILNKPQDEAEARHMIATLRGQTHRVLTGVCLRYGKNCDESLVEHETTVVKFCDVSDTWIQQYVATGEPMDKAGAYAAQGLGALIIERLEGDFYNVVGLPLSRLGRMLERIGAPIEMWWESVKAQNRITES